MPRSSLELVGKEVAVGIESSEGNYQQDGFLENIEGVGIYLRTKEGHRLIPWHVISYITAIVRQTEIETLKEPEQFNNFCSYQKGE